MQVSYQFIQKRLVSSGTESERLVIWKNLSVSLAIRSTKRVGRKSLLPPSTAPRRHSRSGSGPSSYRPIQPDAACVYDCRSSLQSRSLPNPSTQINPGPSFRVREHHTLPNQPL